MHHRVFAHPTRNIPLRRARRLCIWVAALAVACLAAGAREARPAEAASGFDHFITRAGDRLMDGDEDTVPCYRPLFADVSARPGETWWYRVVARNEGGTSPPSNVVGPVRIERAVLVDEMRDFDRAAGRSDGLRLAHKNNYHFAEHYYRVGGGAGDWLLYRAPDGLEVDGVALSVWHPARRSGNCQPEAR